MPKPIDYKKRYDNLKKRSQKTEESLREELNTAWKKNRELEQGKKYKYIIEIGAQEFSTDMETSKRVAKQRYNAGLVEQRLAKKGDKFTIHKDSESNFQFEDYESFKAKVHELLDAELWFFTTRRTKNGN